MPWSARVTVDNVVGMDERPDCPECHHWTCNGSVGECLICARHGGPCAPWDAHVPRITRAQVDRWIRASTEREETVRNPHEIA